MVTSPLESKNKDYHAQSYYLGNRQNRNEDKRLGSNSVRIDQRRKSKDKSHSKSKMGK